MEPLHNVLPPGEAGGLCPFSIAQQQREYRNTINNILVIKKDRNSTENPKSVFWNITGKQKIFVGNSISQLSYNWKMYEINFHIRFSSTWFVGLLIVSSTFYFFGRFQSMKLNSIWKVLDGKVGSFLPPKISSFTVHYKGAFKNKNVTMYDGSRFLVVFQRVSWRHWTCRIKDTIHFLWSKIRWRVIRESSTDLAESIKRSASDRLSDLVP